MLVDWGATAQMIIDKPKFVCIDKDLMSQNISWILWMEATELAKFMLEVMQTNFSRR